MIVENPEVTLEEEGHGFAEGALSAAMTLWDGVFSAHGDDGRQYRIDTNIGSHRRMGGFGGAPWGEMDMWSLGFSWENGQVVQSPGLAYKIAEFSNTDAIRYYAQPPGSIKIKRSKNEVAVDMEGFHILIKDDKTWHYNVEDKEKGIKAEWVHTGVGYPNWYGKEKPCMYTPHSIAYGYCWPGRIEGELIIKGRKVGIKGAGARERYYSLDACSHEVGGWHDWMWFHFDEMFGSADEYKVSKTKDMSLYIVDGKQYFPAGSFNIEHYDWAYLRPIGAFVPTRYKLTMETEAGLLEMNANVVGCHVWGASGEVPDSPSVSLHWEKVEGTFTYKDGRKKTLTNGVGGTMIRLWKPYPDIYNWHISGIAGAEEARVAKSMPKVD